MALRLPRQAGVILDYARRWFGRAGDAGGELRSATAAALAVLADRGPGGVSTALDRVERSYSRIAGVARLPSWERLREKPADELTHAPRCWQPWTGRAAVLILAASGSQRGPALRVHERFGASNVVDHVALPAELATAVAAMHDRSVPSRSLGPASRSVGLPQPVNLEILGYSTGTHIKRGEFVRVRALSAEGTFLSDAEADQTDPLLPYDVRLHVAVQRSPRCWPLSRRTPRWRCTTRPTTAPRPGRRS